MALKVPPSAQTMELLSRQEALIRSERKQVEVDHSAFFYKSTKQIKQEKYDLRHKKNFLRVLKMHTVMPKILAQATEPPKIYTKDYSIDVEALMHETRAKLQDNLEVDASDVDTTSQDSRSEKMQPSTRTKAKSLRSMKSITSATNQQKQSATQKNVKPIWAQEREKSAAILAKKKAMDRWNNQTDVLPLGAVVQIDKKARQQITKIELGQDPNQAIKKAAFARGILGQMDRVANKGLRQLRQKIRKQSVMGPDSPDGKQLVAASKARDFVANVAKARPHDRIMVQSSSQKKTPVNHTHRVKMTFEQLPKHLQEVVLDPSQNDHLNASQNQDDYGSSNILLGAGGFKDARSRSSCRLSYAMRNSTVQTKSSIAQRLRTNKPMNAKPCLALASKFDQTSQSRKVDFTKTNTTEVWNQQRDRKNKSLMPGLSKTISLRRTNFDDTKEEPDMQAATALQAKDQTIDRKEGDEPNKNGVDKAGESSFKANNNEDKAPMTLGQRLKQLQMMKNAANDQSKTQSFGQSMQQNAEAKRQGNMRRTTEVQLSKERSEMVNSSQDNHSLQVPAYQRMSKAQSTNAYSHASIKTRVQSASIRTERKRRHPSESISNLPDSQMRKLNRKMSAKHREQGGTVPIRFEVKEDQVPVKLNDGTYLVRQNFFYEKPKRYSIHFARAAVYKNGCLTCGSENVEVENFGQRYCCATCQKSLQTPAGDSVTLRASFDGRYIVAQAWKYSRPLKNVEVNIDDLRIRGGHKCHATFAGEKGDIIVLIDEVDEDYVYH